MVEFRCLGVLRFEGLDPAREETLVAHPRCIAVLCYLLLSAPGSSVGREALAEIFWPEAARKRALGSLRVAVHRLRAQLGAEAIRTVGDRLAIDAERLSCDALAFASRLDERRFQEALELYHGELLPGLQIRGAPRFDEWLADRRSALARDAGEAVRALGSPADRPPGSRSRRLAVLPFQLPGEDPQHPHFASGLAHEVIGSLARLSGIQVVAHSSTDRYRDRSGATLADIARRLGADAVLDGSIRPVANQVLIVARLVSGHSEAPIWADIYECGAGELLSVKTRMVTDVLSALRVDLSADEKQRLERRPTSSSEAYELYVRGRALWSNRSRPSVEAAIGHFKEALALDPEFALGLAGLADAYLMLHAAAGVRREESTARVRQAGLAALRLDPDLGDVRATLGLLSVLNAEWAEAERELRRAVELSPGHATAHHWLGAFLCYVRADYEEGLAALEVARQLDPHSSIVKSDLGLIQVHRGERDRARDTLSGVLDSDPGFWRAHYDFGVTCFLAGEPDLGKAHLSQAWGLGAFGEEPGEAPDEPPGTGWREVLSRKIKRLESSPSHRGTGAFEAALLATFLGHRKEALGWLNKADVAGMWVWIVMYLPAFAPLHSDDQFRRLVAAAGLGHLLDRP